MILAQPLLGSTVKCDGNESDPYAFLTVLNMHQHRDVTVMAQLRDYLLARATKAQGNTDVKQQLEQLLSSKSKAQVGLILTERLINMPHQIVPPMYNMLQEEIQWANDEGEPYQFTHYLIISKTYAEVASQLDAEDSRPQKKKKAGSGGGPEVFLFHPEDEILQKHALASCGFDYSQPSEDGASDSKRAFQELGVKPQGSLMLFEASKFEGAVEAVGEFLGSES